jgi:hypothetical protein
MSTPTQFRAEIDALNKARDEAAALQKQAQQAQADANAANAALAQRVAEFETMRSEIRRKIVGAEV